MLPFSIIIFIGEKISGIYQIEEKYYKHDAYGKARIIFKIFFDLLHNQSDNFLSKDINLVP
jgi:hypothetical protein